MINEQHYENLKKLEDEINKIDFKKRLVRNLSVVKGESWESWKIGFDEDYVYDEDLGREFGKEPLERVVSIAKKELNEIIKDEEARLREEYEKYEILYKNER